MAFRRGDIDLEELLGQVHAASSAPELARQLLAEAAHLFEEAGPDEKARELLPDAIGSWVSPGCSAPPSVHSSVGHDADIRFRELTSRPVGSV